MVEIIRGKCKPTIICCSYRAPDEDYGEFISCLESCMPAVDLDKYDLVLLGDLNVNMLPNSKPQGRKTKVNNFFAHDGFNSTHKRANPYC